MFKLLTIAVLGYLLYRFFIQQPQIRSGQGETQKPDHDDEYIDYEEVE